jgi:hypothetical protein
MSDQFEEKKYTSLYQLPDDPLAMPPPYWRSTGANSIVVEMLEDIVNLLEELITVKADTKEQLDDFYSKHPDDFSDDAALEEFSNICNDLFDLESKVGLRCDTAIMMSAIATEDRINCFCVYNLHKDAADSIEKLTMPEKTIMASALVGKTNIKREAAFESVRRLTSWRNAFAHGHCTDRPLRSLRHNHLIHPDEYPGIRDDISSLKELVGGYVRVSDFLRSISLNPYTSASLYEVEQMRACLSEISKYRLEGTNEAYTIVIDKQPR